MFELMNLKKDGIYYAYVRKSRADEALESYKKIDTLKQHTEFINKRANQLDIKVKKWYKEVVSGDSIEDRPQIKQMLKEIESGFVDGVIVVDIDRLARGDTTDQGKISRTFKYTNTKIITLYKIYDPNNEDDEDFFEFNLFMARKEYKAINKRQQRGRLSSVLSGKFCASEPPYGYEKIKIKGDKGFTLKPLENESKIIKTIFQKRANGTGLNIICNYLNNLEIQPKRSDVWTPATLTSILTNPVYIGKIRWNYNKTQKNIQNGEVVKIRKKSNSNDTILVEGLHPAIIDIDTFNKVQNNKTPITPLKNNKELKNPLSGLVRCAFCGRSMVRRPYSTKVTRKAENSLNKKELLDCLRKHKNHSLNEIAKYCGKTKYTVDKWFPTKVQSFVVPPYECFLKLKKYLNIKTNKFDKEVENYHKVLEVIPIDSIMCPKAHCDNIASHLYLVEKQVIDITTAYLKQKKKLLEEYDLKSPNEDFKMIDVLKKKNNELNSRLDKAYDLVEQGVYTAEEFTKRTKKIKKQIEINKKELNKLCSANNRDIKPMIAEAEEILNVYYNTKNIEDKNNMLKSIIDHIEYTKLKKYKDFDLKIYFKF